MRKYLVLLLFPFLYGQDSTKIMFLGDSYTDQDFGGGYKPYVMHYFDTTGYLVKFVGHYNTQNNGTAYFNGAAATGYLDFDYPVSRRYHNGKTSKQAAQWVSGTGSDTMTVTEVVTWYRPQILVIYIGLNDVANGSFSTTTIKNNVSSMLDQAWAVDTTIKIVLCNLAKTQNTAYYDSINAYNAKLPALVASKANRLIWLADVDAVMNETTDFFSDSHPSGSYGATRNTVGYYHLATAIYPYIKLALDYVAPTPTKYLLWRR